MVSKKSAMMRRAPSFMLISAPLTSGFSFGTAKLMQIAGIIQLMTDGIKMAKNSKKLTLPFCQTIKVVMSPKGENAPPALAATTIFMQATTMNVLLLPPTAMATAPISRAVVRLSATGEITKDSRPVNQKTVRSVNPLLTIHDRNALNTLRSSRALM